MSNILDLAKVINTGSPSRDYLIPWIKDKLNLHSDYVIVNDNLLNVDHTYLQGHDTVILDCSHNPVSRQDILTFCNSHNKNIFVLSPYANDIYYTSYFHLKYSAGEYETFTDDIIHKFSSLNSVPKMNRIMLINELYKQCINDSVLHSFWWTEQNHAKDHVQTEYFLESIKKWPEAFDFFKKQIEPKCPIKIEENYSERVYNNDHTISSPAYKNTACNIVTESTYDEIFYTEKTWKPIYAKQLFLHAGAKHSIKFLRELGFDVFDDFIDHSYDNEEDLEKRIKMCISEVGRLSADILQIYADTKERRQKNFEYLKSDDFCKKVEIRI